MTPLAPVLPPQRVVADGKFFRLGGSKFFLKGITYGPFAPDENGVTFAPPERTARDFHLMRKLGANGLRVYYPPPLWFLDLAQEQGLKVLIDIPWPKHLCFLDAEETRQERATSCARRWQEPRGTPPCSRSAWSTKSPRKLSAGVAWRASSASSTNSSTWPGPWTRRLSTLSPTIRRRNFSGRATSTSSASTSICTGQKTSKLTWPDCKCR